MTTPMTNTLPVLTTLQRHPVSVDLFSRVHVKEFKLSIQGSRSSYCSPREDLEPSQYTSFELAIFDKEGNEVDVAESITLKSFPRYYELVKLIEPSTINIMGFAPIDLINDLYLHLRGY